MRGSLSSHCLRRVATSLSSLVPIFHWMAVPPWLVNAAQLSARSSMSTASLKPTPWVASHGPKNAWGSSLFSAPVWLEQMRASQMTAQSASVSRSRPGRRLRLRACSKARAKHVTANPHLTEDWAQRAVTCGQLIGYVCTLIGADIAVENTFLMIKRPGDGFTVPAHQDGINDRIQLDPARSVAVWLAISGASPANGGLQIVRRLPMGPSWSVILLRHRGARIAADFLLACGSGAGTGSRLARRGDMIGACRLCTGGSPW